MRTTRNRSFAVGGLAALAALVWFGACANPPLDELLAGKACSPSGECAPGYECDAATHLCVVPGTQGQGGTGGSDHCDTVSDCPAPASLCELPLCLDHHCGTLPSAAGPLPAVRQLAGDCKVITCDGLGTAVVENDDTDIPVDGEECTGDVCIGGVPSNAPAGAGTSCSEGNGTRCDAAGHCVGCNAVADCTQIATTECRSPSCNAGSCLPTFTMSGAAQALQTAGDCQLAVCDGAGGVTAQVDDGDEPFDDNPCTQDLCNGGVASNPPEAPNTPCGGVLTCDGAGHCLGCVAPNDCPGADDACKVRSCTGGVCGFHYTANGTPLPAGAQTAADCQEAQCNGTGGVKFVPLDSDVPADEGNECTLETCNNGAPLHPAVASGMSCTNGGSVCDGAGSCVACNAPGDCANQGTVCQAASCASHVCGLTNTAAGQPAPAGTQTPGDCTLVTCDGSGGTTMSADANDLPHDGNDCTADVCTATTPSNPPLPAGTACAGGGTCNGSGVCSVHKPLGDPCSAGDQCTSGNCVDGVCCASSCTDPCKACSAAKTGGSDGTCAFVPAGQDPDLECTTPNTCNGAGACAFECGQQPAPPGGSCPAACTGGCASGTCIIACNSTGQCANQTLSCPPGFACTVQCGANQACDGATITCPADYACRVVCSGTCKNAQIACGSGTCDLTCGNGKCQNSTLSCGANRCTASCQGNHNWFPAVNCNGSCDCTSC